MVKAELQKINYKPIIYILGGDSSAALWCSFGVFFCKIPQPEGVLRVPNRWGGLILCVKSS